MSFSAIHIRFRSTYFELPTSTVPSSSWISTSCPNWARSSVKASCLSALLRQSPCPSATVAPKQHQQFPIDLDFQGHQEQGFVSEPESVYQDALVQAYADLPASYFSAPNDGQTAQFLQHDSSNAMQGQMPTDSASREGDASSLHSAHFTVSRHMSQASSTTYESPQLDTNYLQPPPQQQQQQSRKRSRQDDVYLDYPVSQQLQTRPSPLGIEIPFGMAQHAISPVESFASYQLGTPHLQQQNFAQGPSMQSTSVSPHSPLQYQPQQQQQQQQSSLPSSAIDDTEYHHHHHHRLPEQQPITKAARRSISDDPFTADTSRDISHITVVGNEGMPFPAARPRGPNLKFTAEDDALLVELKESKNLTWKQIADFFPGRSSGTLQVRYCTKLKAKSHGWNDEMVSKLRASIREYDSDRWRAISAKVGNGFSAASCKDKAMELEAYEIQAMELEEERRRRQHQQQQQQQQQVQGRGYASGSSAEQHEQKYDQKYEQPPLSQSSGFFEM